MPSYTLIASRDPFESRDSEHLWALAKDLRRGGHEVTLYLVQNGVLAARRNPLSPTLAELAGLGVKVRADGFSLRERGIPPERMEPGVEPAELDLIVDHLAEGRRVLWH